MTTPFDRIPNENPATGEQIAKVLTDPGFGRYGTDHMVTTDFNPERGWHNAAVRPFAPLTLSPCASALHYGQAIFEGLKAYRQRDGSVASFRPSMNALRFRSSARRLAMPELPGELFLTSLGELVAMDERWVPEGKEKALYLRPLMIATSTHLKVTPATEYLYVLMAMPVASYFSDGLRPVSVWLSREYSRAAPGGTGAAKCAGNYAGTFLAQEKAHGEGCDQVVWLDPVEHRWVEEMGAMNLFFVLGSGVEARVVTPRLSGSLLPGVTRDSLLRVASDLGYRVEERRVSVEEWEAAAVSGELTEVFACGTAAVITPVGRVKHATGEFLVNSNEAGPITMRLRQRLLAIQAGAADDTHGWMYKLL
ncbi:branched-chain amino acid aminotransferase [Actinomadura sp. 6K520]|uniref:branched-chain amino acid aminotransferase n=1 Tax=Actinomadura sp. 6K520 TaxID=2530364 RepID=UPI001045EF22|nr:branched-chain amino acid aminotransferase [Actinomadura sp. 6K520]TDE32819.1 branched-chain amino acid aminotransferase [Actinomadura sp. 6K520]